MKVVGIIAEYNPFHNGHAYQIQYIRETLHADYVIAVMSGDFVQRGTPALFPKHIRAEMALRNGIDLVLELPVHVSTASAEGFASGAVRMLDSLGCVEALCFGSESGDISLFQKTAEILCQEPESYRMMLSESLKAGKSFPEARSYALKAYFSESHNTDSLNEFLSTPNNILGIEYCKALHRLNSSIKPVTLKRTGHAYHDTELNKDAFPSASGIRSYIKNNEQFPTANDRSTDSSDIVLQSQVPESVLQLIEESIQKKAFLTIQDYDLLLHQRLLSSVFHHDLNTYLGVTPSLSQRIENTLNSYTGFTSYIELLKTKEITFTSVQRALLHILLEVKKETHAVPDFIPYARVLGFRKNASPLLKEIKKNSSVPFLTKLADAGKILDEAAKSILSENTYTSNVYEAVLSCKSQKEFCHEYKKEIILL